MHTTAIPGDGYVSETQKFRADMAENAADRMMATVKGVAARSGKITKIALWVSTPHQVMFLLSAIIPWMKFDTLEHAGHSLGMALIVLSVPFICDYTILNCVETISAPAIDAWTKRKAFIVLTITACVSGSVNFLAPAPWLVKFLAAFVTVAILMAESMRNIGVNFNRMEAIEQDIAVGAPAKPAKLVIDKNELRARKEAGYDQMTPQGKRAFTKARRERIANRAPRATKLTPVQQIQALTTTAPVSPAPAGA